MAAFGGVQLLKGCNFFRTRDTKRGAGIELWYQSSYDPLIVPSVYGSGSIDAVAVDRYGSTFAAGYQNHSWTIGELYHVRDDRSSCDSFFPVEVEYDQVQEAPPVIAGARVLKGNRMVLTSQSV